MRAAGARMETKQTAERSASTNCSVESASPPDERGISSGRSTTRHGRVYSVPDALALGLALTAAGIIAWFARGWFFYHDDWNIIFYRRSGGVHAFFAPYLDNLFAGVIFLYRVLFATVGLRHIGPYIGVELTLHILCAGLLYVYLRRRGVLPWLCLSILAVLLLLGSGWQAMVWLACAGFVIPLIAMLGILLLWDSKLRRADLFAFMLACVGLLSHATSVPILLGLIVASIGTGLRPTRLAALGLPLVGWAFWFLAVRPTLLPPASLRHIAGSAPPSRSISLAHLDLNLLGPWLWHSLEGSLGALAGKPNSAVVALLVGFFGAGLLAWALIRRQLGWRTLGMMIAVLGFWCSGWVASANEIVSPTASRYLYPGAVFLLMLIGECLRGINVKAPVAALTVVLVALILSSNVDQLRVNSDVASAQFARAKVALADLEGCRGRLAPTFRFPPDLSSLEGGTTSAAFGVRAGPFWAATAALGKPVPAVSPRHDPLCPETM